MGTERNPDLGIDVKAWPLTVPLPPPKVWIKPNNELKKAIGESNLKENCEIYFGGLMGDSYYFDVKEINN